MPRVEEGNAWMEGCSRRLGRGLALAAVAGVLVFAVPLARALEIHVSPQGADELDGAVPGRAVRTLQRALDLALQAPPSTEPVRIMISPGRYADAGALVRPVAPTGPRIVLSPRVPGPEGRVIFIGRGARDTWLQWKDVRGMATGLEIRGLEFKNYGTAISLDGDRNHAERGNRGTVIENNVFRDIGATGQDTGTLTTAAVRLVNSSGNRIVSNLFLSVRSTVGCSAMHSVYLAHFSSGNEIRNNEFSDFCGSPIKLRDRSNDNAIAGNLFSKGEGVAAIEEQFCDNQQRQDCTKRAGECPSVGNVASGNEVTASPRLRSFLKASPQGLTRSWCDARSIEDSRVAIH